MEWSDIFSGISAFIAAIALYVSWRAFKKASSIDVGRRDDEIKDRDSALITARVERKPGSKHHLILIDNKGDGVARLKNVTIGKQPIQDHPAIFDRTLIHDVVPPRSQVAYEISLDKSTPTPRKIEIIWDDDFDENRVHKETLTY